MKKGIMELSDLVIVNKSDGALVDSARYAQIEYTSALKFVKAITSFWKARVIRVSSMGGPEGGIDKAWDTMKEYFEIMEVNIIFASCFFGIEMLTLTLASTFTPYTVVRRTAKETWTSAQDLDVAPSVVRAHGSSERGCTGARNG